MKSLLSELLREALFTFGAVKPELRKSVRSASSRNANFGNNVLRISVLIFVSGWGGFFPGGEPKNSDFDLKTLENLLFFSPPQAPPKN